MIKMPLVVLVVTLVTSVTKKELQTNVNVYVFVLVMEKSKQLGGCHCGLDLGVEQLSAQDVKDFQNHINQPIDFQGPGGSYEQTLMKTKIEEVKERIGEYYFDKENKLIAIPNQIALPKKPHIIDLDEENCNVRNRNNIFIDKNCEYKLHQSIIRALREIKLQAFVIQGFQSKDCIKAKLEKGKNLRREQRCKCKTLNVCDCGKVRYPDLNIHENDVMELLDIKKIKVEDIEKCSQLLKVLKIREKNKEVTDGKPTKARKQKLEEVLGESWLFSKVNILNSSLNKLVAFFTKKIIAFLLENLIKQ